MAAERNSGAGPTWLAVAEWAQRQHGVVSHGQLRRLGLAERTIGRAIATGRLHPIFRGAYGVGHIPQTRNAQLVAATLACGEGSVVSHGTAAALLGLWQQPPPLIDVIAPVEAGRKIDGIRRRHTPFPTAVEVWIHDGVPCTTPARTIVDIAGMSGERTVRRAIEQAAVRRMLNIPEIDAVLDGPRRRGSRLLCRILMLWRRYPPALVIRSPQEAKLLPLLTEYGLAAPLVNEKLTVGSEVFELDFYWRRGRLVIETDGGRFHDNPQAAARDRHRNRVLRAARFRVWRLDWDDVTRSAEATMAELARLLRDPARQPPQ